MRVAARLNLGARCPFGIWNDLNARDGTSCSLRIEEGGRECKPGGRRRTRSATLTTLTCGSGRPSPFGGRTSTLCAASCASSGLSASGDADTPKGDHGRPVDVSKGLRAALRRLRARAGEAALRHSDGSKGQLFPANRRFPGLGPKPETY